jgi:hypothetical protein
MDSLWTTVEFHSNSALQGNTRATDGNPPDAERGPRNPRDHPWLDALLRDELLLLHEHPAGPWEIDLGIGVGLTTATDGLIIKSIIGRRF